MSDLETFEERLGGALDALYEAATLMTGDPARAEQLVIGSVVEASRDYRREAPGRTFETWLLVRVVRRYVSAVPDADETTSEDDARGEGAPGGEVASRATMQRMSRLLADSDGSTKLTAWIGEELRSLPLEERVAVWLVSARGLSYAEAAEALGEDRDGIRVLLWRGRRRLQVLVASRLGPEGSRLRSRGGGTDPARSE